MGGKGGSSAITARQRDLLSSARLEIYHIFRDIYTYAVAQGTGDTTGEAGAKPGTVDTIGKVGVETGEGDATGGVGAGPEAGNAISEADAEPGANNAIGTTRVAEHFINFCRCNSTW